MINSFRNHLIKKAQMAGQASAQLGSMYGPSVSTGMRYGTKVSEIVKYTRKKKGEKK